MSTALVLDHPSQETQPSTKVPAFDAWWWPATLLERVASIVSVVALFAGVLITLAGILGRVTNWYTLIWENEAGILVLSILAYVGASVAYRRREFASLVWLDARLRPAHRQYLDRSRDMLTAGIAIILTPMTWNFAYSQVAVQDPFLHISEFWMFVPVPIGTGLLAVFALERVVKRRSFPLPEIVSALVLAAIFELLAQVFFTGLGATGPAIASCVLVLALLILGVPLPVGFATAGLAFVKLSGNPTSLIGSGLTDSTASFLLVAIPFFLFTGFLMAEGKLSATLARALSSMMGRLPGGIRHIIVVSMFLFSGVSGSKAGDMAAVGKAAVSMAEETGVPTAEAMAVLSASAAMGDTIPPSIGLIVLASISSLSVTALFLGGILPAAVTALALFVIIGLRARKGASGEVALQVKGRARLKLIAQATPFTIVPAIILVGIVGGYTTPTEASALAVLASVVLLCFIYRNISLRAFWRVSVDSSVMAGAVLFIVATASLFARALTLAQIPQDIANFAASGGFGGRWGFLLATSAVLVVLGMVMEGLPAILVFAPILIPVATAMGINPLQYGIIIVMAIGIGANSPPIGIGVFISSQIGGVPVEDVSKRMRPYVIFLYIGLLAVMTIPGLVTWLPNIFNVT